jgi:outer membrane lipoprotein SlyB
MPFPLSVSANERTAMRRAFFVRASLASAGFLVPAFLAGCQPNYSPDTYASAAAQQANKVDPGVIVGVRAVQISADTTLVTGTTAAAGGIAGSQMGAGAGGAFGALGGTVAGGVVGNVVGHAQGDTDGFEYIVRKDNSNDMISVTQKDLKALGVGAHVLVIEGPQARVVPDYTVPVVSQPLHPEPPKAADAGKPADAGKSADSGKSAAESAKPAAGDTAKPAAEAQKPAAEAAAKAVETAPIPAPAATNPPPAPTSAPAALLPPAGGAAEATPPVPTAKPDDAAPKPSGS